MKDEIIILNELREIQRQISDIHFVYNDNIDKYNKVMRQDYSVITDLLYQISTGRNTMAKVRDYKYTQRLQGLINVLDMFLNDIKNDENNQVLLKSLKNKEVELKTKLGIT